MAAKESLVMYIVLRKDLLTALNWPMGAMVTQACHAVTAVSWEHREDENVKQYMADIDHMRKVTLQVDDQEGLLSTAKRLSEAQIDHKLWIEQPENVPTCIAVKPYYKTIVHPFLKHLKLF